MVADRIRGTSPQSTTTTWSAGIPGSAFATIRYATLGPERFLREIEVAARLQHPHILPLHDSGEADGFLFYVMPFVEGQSLRDKLAKEGELPIGEAVRVVRDVVDALTAAHAHGVVHQDAAQGRRH